MHALIRRLNELCGFHVRVHVHQGRSTFTVDGTCQGVEDDCAILAPSTQGERAEIPLKQIAAVTPLAGEFGEYDGSF